MEDLLDRLCNLSDADLDRLITYLAALKTQDSEAPQSACPPAVSE